MKGIVKELKLAPSFLTYKITLFVKLNLMKRKFIFLVKVAPKVF
jgi:hypothetical protein